jgi:hypothetical protein
MELGIGYILTPGERSDSNVVMEEVNEDENNNEDAGHFTASI